MQVFTVGVMVSDKRTGNPICRWCYDGMHAATEALEAWTGEGDPPGEWIKFNGIGPDGRPHDRSRVVHSHRAATAESASADDDHGQDAA